MEIFRYSTTPDRTIEVFNSRGAFITPLIQHSSIHVVTVRLEPQGILGLHPAAADQLFLVTAGDAFVSTDKISELLVESGSAVLWKEGELHQTRAGGSGLLAIVIEAERLARSIRIEPAGSVPDSPA